MQCTGLTEPNLYPVLISFYQYSIRIYVYVSVVSRCMMHIGSFIQTNTVFSYIVIAYSSVLSSMYNCWHFRPFKHWWLTVMVPVLKLRLNMDVEVLPTGRNITILVHPMATSARMYARMYVYCCVTLLLTSVVMIGCSSYRMSRCYYRSVGQIVSHMPTYIMSH